MSSFLDITLIRHGQTDWNLQKKLQGHSDIPLNAQGEEQALVLKKRLADDSFDVVFSSDLSRAYKTASIVTDGRSVEIIKTDRLRERSLGEWEGQSISALVSQITPPSSKSDYLSFKACSNSESYDEVFERLRSFIQSQTENYKSVLLSSHGGVMRALLYQFEFHADKKWYVPNCSWIKLRYHSNGEITIVDKDKEIQLKTEVPVPH